MSNDPLNTGTVKLFLNVIGEESGRFEIKEPVGFDALNFVLKQDTKRYGRDVSFSDVELTFYKKTNRKAFDKLIELDKTQGFESQVQFIIQVDGTDFVQGELEFSKRFTDQYTYFKVNVLQSSNQAKIKRKQDIKVSLFSDVDLEGNEITPIQTYKILQKSKPVVQVSSWLKTDLRVSTGISEGFNALYQNPLRNLTSTGIDNSLTFIRSFTTANNDVMANADDFKLIEAENDLTDNTIKFEDIKIKYQVPVGESFEDPPSWFFQEVEIGFLIHIGVDPAPSTFSSEFDLAFTYVFNGTVNTPDGLLNEYLVTITDVTYTLPTIGRDLSLWGIFNLGRLFTVTEWVSGNITISSTATGIDSVITGVRLIDAQKQVVKSINGNTVIAPRFDQGGQFYDNFIFNGRLIRQITDKPFQVEFKSIANQLQEFNCDYQSNENTVDIANYSDFYNNVEIAAFNNVDFGEPFEDFGIQYNERYLINEVRVKYKSFEQDKDEKNTIDAVHTEAQYLVPNNKTENKKEIDGLFTRDPFKLEFLRVRNTQSDGTTSLSGDDDIFILDVIELAPNTTRTITASFTHNIDGDGNVDLLNDGTFNWTLLGFNVGDSFTIDATENTGNYTVVESTFNVVTLQPIGFTPTFGGVSLTTVTYPITDVLYTNRTNEGFSNIEGVANPNDYSNLNYTIRRNLEYWKSYISTAMRFNQRNVTNTFFINEPTLKTTKTGESEVVEISGIEKTDLDNAILSPNMIKTTVTGVDFYTHANMVSQIRENKGFFRIADNLGRMLKVHPIKTDYTWSTNVLDIEAEIRQESEFVTINKIGGIIEISETGYPVDLVYPINYVTDYNYIQLFDNNSVPLTNKTLYNFVKVNGVAYNSIEELTIALSEL